MTTKSKGPKNGRDYLPWAGFFLNPDRDPELFLTLPGWRQRQLRFFTEEAKAGRTPSRAQIEEAGRAVRNLSPGLSIPEEVSLSSLRMRSRFDPLPSHLASTITEAAALEHCTENGEGRRLLSAPPRNGVFSYIWGRARAIAGLDPTLPLTRYLDLEEGIYELTGRYYMVGYSTTSLLDRVAESLVEQLA